MTYSITCRSVMLSVRERAAPRSYFVTFCFYCQMSHTLCSGCTEFLKMDEHLETNRIQIYF